MKKNKGFSEKPKTAFEEKRLAKKEKTFERKKLVELGEGFLAVFFPFSEAMKQVYLIFHGYDFWYFPFQLCSLDIYFLPIYMALKYWQERRPENRTRGERCQKNKRISEKDPGETLEKDPGETLEKDPGEILEKDPGETLEIGHEKARKTLRSFIRDFSLLGGTAAFFDTSGMIYKNWILTLHSILWHIFMVLLGILLIYEEILEKDRLPKMDAETPRLPKMDAETLRQRAQYFPEAVILFFSMCLSEIFNISFSSYGTINMFYINPYLKMQQLYFSQIGEKYGNPVGIISYIAAIFLGGCIINRICSYLIFRTLKTSETENP